MLFPSSFFPPLPYSNNIYLNHSLTHHLLSRHQAPTKPPRRRARHRHWRRRKGLVRHPGHREAQARRGRAAPHRGAYRGGRSRDGVPPLARAEAARHKREHKQPRQVVRRRHHLAAGHPVGVADYVPEGVLPLKALDLEGREQ